MCGCGCGRGVGAMCVFDVGVDVGVDLVCDVGCVLCVLRHRGGGYASWVCPWGDDGGP